MTPGFVLLLASSLVAVVAVLVITDLIDPARAAAGRTRRRGATGDDTASELAWRIAAATAIGTLVVTSTGWVLPAAVVAIGAWRIVAGVQRRRRDTASTSVEMTEGLASWIESLRDVLIAGDQPIGAIGTTVSTCPPVLRPHVRRLAARLDHVAPAVAFRRFADDVDEPLGDLIAAGLLIAVERGARTVGVLNSLSAQARHQADRRRIVAAERAPVRREVGVLTAIMGSLIGALFLFGRSSYLSAYDTAGGQLFLAVCLVAYGLLLVRVQRLARESRPARFLSMERAAPSQRAAHDVGAPRAAVSPPSHGGIGCGLVGNGGRR